MINVYRHKLVGRRLVGWIDDDGITYKRDGIVPKKHIEDPPLGIWRLTFSAILSIFTPTRFAPQPIKWSSDKQGRIYLDSGELHALCGTFRRRDGAVFVEYGETSLGEDNLFAFWIRSDGSVYRLTPMGPRYGTIEGTSDLVTIAALSLLLLR